MEKFFAYIRDMVANPVVRKKLLFTLGILLLYRFLVFVPVPFADL
jgi:preprotein translocase subunit SecY